MKNNHRPKQQKNGLKARRGRGGVGCPDTFGQIQKKKKKNPESHSTLTPFPSSFSDAIWSAAKCRPVCASDFFLCVRMCHCVHLSLQRDSDFHLFWSAVSQHMDSRTRFVPHPPHSQQSALEHIQTWYEPWLINICSYTSPALLLCIPDTCITPNVKRRRSFPAHIHYTLHYTCFHYFIFNTASKLLA